MTNSDPTAKNSVNDFNEECTKAVASDDAGAEGMKATKADDPGEKGTKANDSGTESMDAATPDDPGKKGAKVPPPEELIEECMKAPTPDEQIRRLKDKLTEVYGQVVLQDKYIRGLETDLDKERKTIVLRDTQITRLERELTQTTEQLNKRKSDYWELRIKQLFLDFKATSMAAAWQAVESTLSEETKLLVESNVDRACLLYLVMYSAGRAEYFEGQMKAAQEQETVLRERIRLMTSNTYGARSERSARLKVTGLQQLGQLDFLNDMGATALVEEDTETKEVVVKAHVRRVRNHKKAECVNRLPEDTKQNVIVVEVSEEQKECPVCHDEMHLIAYRELDEVRIKPLTVELDRYLLAVYGCRHCDHHGVSVPMTTAVAPARALPGSWAAAETIAWVMVQKYEMALSYYRIEEALQSAGLWIPRSTLSGWPIQMAERWLGPLADYIHRILLAQAVVHADETEWKCLQDAGKSYLWGLRSGPSEAEQLVFFQYRSGRSKSDAAALVGGFENYLLTDGYQAYSAGVPDATIAFCWAHARRKWADAVKILQPKGSNLLYQANLTSFVVTSVPQGDKNAEPKPVLGRLAEAMIGLTFCNQLYEIEEKAAEMTPEERKDLREQLSKPILEKFHAWFEPRVKRDEHGKPTGKDCVSVALNYLANHWDGLQKYLEDGRIPIDNNRLESLIRGVALVRKNSLFSTSKAGAEATATLASIVESGKAAGLDPYRYLCWLLREMPKAAQELMQEGKIRKMKAVEFDDETLKRFLPSQAPDSVRKPRLSEIEPLKIGPVTDVMISADRLCELIHALRTGEGADNAAVQEFDEAVETFRKSVLTNIAANTTEEILEATA